jgi:hypothetical protein
MEWHTAHVMVFRALVWLLVMAGQLRNVAETLQQDT